MTTTHTETSAHTPGPWSCSTIDNSILAPGPQFCDLVIAKMGNQARRTEANARLIAAAPELLEALKIAVRYVEESNSPYHAEHNQALDMIRAAIAKAEGTK